MLFFAELVALLIQGVVIIKDLLGDQVLIHGKKRDPVESMHGVEMNMERMPILLAVSADPDKLT